MGFDEDGNFYGEEYRWEKNQEPGWGHPPMFYSSGTENLSDTEQAANVAAALLHSAIEAIGAIPVKSDHSGDLLDADLCAFLAKLSGLAPSALRAGLMLLRSDGYRLMKLWTIHDEDGWDEGREQLWPRPTPGEDIR